MEIVVAPDAIVLLANHALMRRGEGRAYGRVQSRMLLWCLDGAGTVTANGRRYHLEPGVFLILPWHHAISYEPARMLQLAGVHVIPALAAGLPISYGIIHQSPGRENPMDADRHDVALPLLAEVISGDLDAAPALQLLADYALRRCMAPAFEESTARLLGRLLIREWQLTALSMQERRETLPEPLARVVAEVETRLAEPWSLKELARLAGCSRSSLNRLFRDHLGASPIAWLISRRLRKAAGLLATTALPTGEIGDQVGIGDPCYFSRLFRQHHGMSCTEYRHRHALLSHG